MLFTCPSRYSSTIGHTGVFSLGGWSPPLHASLLGTKALLRNSTTSSAWLWATGLSPSLAPHSRGLHLASLAASVGPTTPIPQGDRFGLGRFRSPLLSASRLISLPPGTEMFQFPGFASPCLCIQHGITSPLNSDPATVETAAGAKFNGEVGFPHSEIAGSKFAHNSPTLIAACHVLHRLYMPRHPPNALTSRLRIHTINDRPA